MQTAERTASGGEHAGTMGVEKIAGTGSRVGLSVAVYTVALANNTNAGVPQVCGWVIESASARTTVAD